jgi:cellulose biosynthesis protein BcsQ
LHNATIQILTIVPTMVQANHNLTREMYAQLRERYGKQLLSAPVPMLTGVAQGPALGGLTIFDHDPTSAAAVAYRYLGERVMTAA